MRVVLDEERLLAIVTGLVEEKIERRGGIEDGLASSVRLANLGGSDVVGKLFVNEAVDGIGSSFNFVVVEVGGNGGADIPFAKTAILKRLNGPGSWIGGECGFVVAHAPLHGAEDVRGESVLIRDLARDFPIAAILALQVLLLNEFVRNEETGA